MKLLLSYREAAALIGVGRNKSLHEMIEKGLLRPVILLGRAFIPREQVEALAKSGEQPLKVSDSRFKPMKPKRRNGKSIADVEI